MFIRHWYAQNVNNVTLKRFYRIFTEIVQKNRKIGSATKFFLKKNFSSSTCTLYMVAASGKTQNCFVLSVMMSLCSCS